MAKRSPASVVFATIAFNKEKSFSTKSHEENNRFNQFQKTARMLVPPEEKRERARPPPYELNLGSFTYWFYIVGTDR
jgi:hypothetical protein